MSAVYSWVIATRKGLLDYCEGLPVEAFVERRQEFGLGSMRGALVHVADCYRYWLVSTLFGRRVQPLAGADYPDAASVRRLFAELVDPLVGEFLAAYPCAQAGVDLRLSVSWKQEPLDVTPLWLLTHTVTHEFHHKGQAVAFGRLLGYPPPETDLAML
jgi:uncharacterized damage-inducible protein DinB